MMNIFPNEKSNIITLNISYTETQKFAINIQLSFPSNLIELFGMILTIYLNLFVQRLLFPSVAEPETEP
jgi:hypothetical protein